eukprot:630696-Karenia_brevis.AAC.1
MQSERYGNCTPLCDSEDQESSYNEEDDIMIEAFANRLGRDDCSHAFYVESNDSPISSSWRGGDGGGE